MKAGVYYNNRLAGILYKKDERQFIFTYDPAYFNDPDAPSISLTLSKARAEYSSPVLFPFFSGLLSEGENRTLQQEALGIDAADDFSLLLETASVDTIGAITVREW